MHYIWKSLIYSTRIVFLDGAVVYKFNEKSLRVFEKVSRLLKCGHMHGHQSQPHNPCLRMCVRGKNCVHICTVCSNTKMDTKQALQ